MEDAKCGEGGKDQTVESEMEGNSLDETRRDGASGMKWSRADNVWMEEKTIVVVEECCSALVAAATNDGG